MKKILALVCFFALAMSTQAQNSEGKADDYARIALTSVVPNIEGMPQAAKNFLKSKIDQVATQNGTGGSSKSPRFIITANVTVVTKDITATAPPMTALTLEVTFFVGDGMTMTKFSSASISVKGVGTNETKAYIEGIKAIRVNAPELKAMVDQGKKKIVEFYNSQCDMILKKADALASQNQFDAALYELNQVPDVCKDCYNKVLTATGPVYKKYADKVCLERLNEAKAIWASAQNSQGAQKVAATLAGVDPEAACMAEVKTFVAEVGKKVLELEKRDWDFQVKVFDSSVELEKQRIEAARQVGIAYGNNQPENVTYNVDPWFK